MPLGVDLEQQFQNLGHPLPAQRRREHEWDELQKWSLFLSLLLELGRGVVLLLLEVPFVDDDDQSPSALPRERSDFEILVVQTFHSIQHQDADVGALDRASGSERRIKLDSVIDLRLAAESRRVDEDQLAPVKDHRGVDRVARRPGFVGDDETLLAKKPVDQ